MVEEQQGLLQSFSLRTIHRLRERDKPRLRNLYREQHRAQGSHHIFLRGRGGFEQIPQPD